MGRTLGKCVSVVRGYGGVRSGWVVGDGGASFVILVCQDVSAAEPPTMGMTNEMVVPIDVLVFLGCIRRSWCEIIALLSASTVV